ncbi:MAG: hypothetical protein HC844_01210 [Tabrizicola sp.]|nr:hypothetical protein [Tabrizicola sp.]
MTRSSDKNYLHHAVYSRNVAELLKKSATHVSDAESLDKAINTVVARSGSLSDEIIWSGGGAAFELKVEANDLSGEVRVYETNYLGVGSDPVIVATRRDTALRENTSTGFEHSTANSFFVWVQQGVHAIEFGYIPAQFTRSILRDAMLLQNDKDLLSARRDFEKVTALESTTRILRGKLVAAEERQVLSELYSRIEAARLERTRIEKDLKENIEKQVKANKLFERVALLKNIIGIGMLIDDVASVFSDVEKTAIENPDDLFRFVESKKAIVEGATIEMTRTMEISRDKEKVTYDEFVDFAERHGVPKDAIEIIYK